jgi:hypothetical protein
MPFISSLKDSTPRHATIAMAASHILFAYAITHIVIFNRLALAVPKILGDRHAISMNQNRQQMNIADSYFYRPRSLGCSRRTE